MPRFILRDPNEGRADDRVRSACGLFGKHHRGHRLADTSLLRGTRRQKGKTAPHLHPVPQGEWTGRETFTGVPRGHRKARLGVSDFIERSFVSTRHEVGRSADGEEIEREAREGCDGRVLEGGRP